MTTPDPHSHDTQLDALVAHYIEAIERGETPDREKLIAENPALADDLRRFFTDYDRLQLTNLQPADHQVNPEATFILQHEPQPGTIFGGRYKLLQNIGEGGMGSVWVAEQKEPVKRKVAIKLVKAGMDSKQVLARFEAERQALAMMDHPNIAKVFDGGITEHGRPYFVMEYVKGVPFTEYCDKARLSLKERLNLFIPICQAVQHAHHKGIVHRDLKPSNILICRYDGKPVPKVIDFGLAKAMHQQLTEQSIFTAHGAMVGTPLYMSPEQAEHNNLDVDTRTDIYSLGVVLYELLTGTTPLEREQLRTAAYNEVLRLIKEVEPPRPSTRLSGSDSLPSIAAQRSIDPRHLQKSVAGDLDWIVMKSLEKERSRRYETATSLQRDIERFLADEAVEACPPSLGYRLKKYVRRHKPQVIAVSLIFSALLIATAATTWGWQKARDAAESVKKALDDVTKERDAKEIERENARIAKEVAEKASHELFNTFRDVTTDAIEKLIREKNGELPTESEREFIQKTIERWQLFADRQGNSLQGLNYRAEGLYQVGRAWIQVNGDKEAFDAFSAAAEIRRRILEIGPNDEANVNGLINGLLQFAQFQDENNESRMLEALALAKRLTAKSRTDENLAREAMCFQHLGAVQDYHGSREAVSSTNSSLVIFEELATRNPDDVKYRFDAAIAHNNLAAMYSKSGDVQSGIRELIASRDVSRELVANDPDNPEYRFHLSSCHHALASWYGQLAGVSSFPKGMTSADELRYAAETEFQNAGSIRFELCAAYPLAVKYQWAHGATACNFGCFLADHDRLTESLEWFDRAIEILNSAMKQFPRNVETRQNLWISHYRRALAFDALKEYKRAAADWSDAILVGSNLSYSNKDDSPDIFDFRLSRAMSLLRSGDYASAVSQIDELYAERLNISSSASQRNETLSAPRKTFKLALLHAIAAEYDSPRRAAFAERSLSLLKKSIADGYDPREAIASIQANVELEALPNYSEFKQLFESLPKALEPAAASSSPDVSAPPQQ